jgi:hypothetical protein
MDESLLTPILLNENPELSALRILATSLDVAEVALVAAYPDSGEPLYSEGCPSEQEAYAISILYQIDALSAVVNRTPRVSGDFENGGAGSLPPTTLHSEETPRERTILERFPQIAQKRHPDQRSHPHAPRSRLEGA